MSIRLLPTARALSLGLLAASLASSAAECRAQGVVGRAGEALDKAGRSIRRGVENAVARGEAAVREASVLDRVYARIHWDKKLNGSVIDLEVQADGTTTLRGAVADAAAKKRAVILARDTVGVTTVVDELTIAANSRATPAPSAKPTRIAPSEPPPAETKVIEKETVPTP
jgi:hypothetical protein